MRAKTEAKNSVAGLKGDIKNLYSKAIFLFF